MTTIEKMILKQINNGMTSNEAENYVCQIIVLNKISKSPLAENVLIKGGVVMFNETHELRRTTQDLDFDFIRYDISNQSIKRFIQLLNKYDSQYRLEVVDIKELKQDDYQGKRVRVFIKDKTKTIQFKMDIGVHTLMDIEQPLTCFSFNNEETIMLRINPPEQMVAEKIYSLAKHGAFSTRYKDIYDIYYFINKGLLDLDITIRCLNCLISNNKHGISSIDDVYKYVTQALNDDDFVKGFELDNKDKWIDENRDTIFQTIFDYISMIKCKMN